MKRLNPNAPKRVKPDSPFCLNGSIHHFQQVSDHTLTAHTIGQIGYVPSKPPRFICIQCGKVITVQ